MNEKKTLSRFQYLYETIRIDRFEHPLPPSSHPSPNFRTRVSFSERKKKKIIDWHFKWTIFSLLKSLASLHVLLFLTQSWEDLMKFLKSNATTTACSSRDRSRSSFRFLDPNELLQRKKERQKGKRNIAVAISRGGNRTEFDNPKSNSRLPRRNLLDIDLNTNRLSTRG